LRSPRVRSNVRRTSTVRSTCTDTGARSRRGEGGWILAGGVTVQEEDVSPLVRVLRSRSNCSPLSMFLRIA
jgi:hypothetical protein